MHVHYVQLCVVSVSQSLFFFLHYDNLFILFFYMNSFVSTCA